MKKIFPIVLLFLIFLLAFFLRTYFCYDKVFSDPIKYVADDGLYHMRLVENELLGNHFPNRIYFDAYTYFPYGTYHNVAPLYGQLLAGSIWLISFGQPTLELINKIAPFYPAVLGSLMVFLVYFIAKALWGRRTALFSALLMAFSSPYLYRSLLGATDHHVAEALFSTLAIMFLIFALKAKNPRPSTVADSGLGKEQKTENKKTKENFLGLRIIKKELSNNNKFWLFTFLTGFSLGLYFLTWSGASLFLFIIFVFIILYYLIKFFTGESPDWILFMGIVIFLITLIMITLFFGYRDFFRINVYNTQHLMALVLGILGFIILGGLCNFIRRKKINRWFLPVFLTLAGISLLIILKLVFPSLFNELIGSIQAINTSKSPYKLVRELTMEMVPLRIQGAINQFSSLFFLSLAALIIVFYKFIKKKKPEHLLIFVWTLIILLMTGIIPFFGQMRYSYYLACNICLLSGFLIVRGFEFGWRGLKIVREIPQKSPIRPYFLVGTILIIFNVIFFLLYPFPFNIDTPYPGTLPYILQRALRIAEIGPLRLTDDWYESLKWLRENTPAPGVDYYSLYQEPGVNKETGKINPYSYPEEAYGILARWDVGYMIIYYAHRIPNATPGHQGIGRKEGEEIKEVGETIFFLETNEEKAIKYLDILKTRYIITDYDSADPNGVFRIKVKFAQGNLEGYLEDGEPSTGPSKFDNSMIARLHLLNGRGTTIKVEENGEKKEFYIKPLNHFRLIYESKETIAYSRQDPDNKIKIVKIFEYVKGARIVGQAEPGTEVTLSTEIETNQERRFTYQKKIKVEDGYFEFIVPYSTFGKEGILADQTQFVVFAQPYKLKIGDKETEVNVSEKDILEGRTIEITAI